MDGPSGEYSSLVIHLAPAPDGFWRVTVDSAHTRLDAPLQPLTLVVRLWQSHDGRLIRGTLRLDTTQTAVPFQTNAQVAQLIRAWLVIDGLNGQP